MPKPARQSEFTIPELMDEIAITGATNRHSTKMTSAEVHEWFAKQLEHAGYNGFRWMGHDDGEWRALAPARQHRMDFSKFAPPYERIIVEIQGGVFTGRAHGSVQGILDTMEKLNLLQVAGFTVYQFTPNQVRSLEAITLFKEWCPL